MIRTLSALALAAVFSVDATDERLRSYDQGREDAQAGFITPGAADQSAYDTGYRELPKPAENYDKNYDKPEDQ